MGTSANVHLTRTSLAISHFESWNIHILNQASPLAQLLPSTAISIPLNSLLGSDCSLWRMADDGGEAQSALISLGWLSCTWRTLHLSTEYQKRSLGCASEAMSTDVKMSSRGRRFIGRPGPILLPKQWPKANDLKEGELTLCSVLYSYSCFSCPRKKKKRPSLTPAALL